MVSLIRPVPFFLPLSKHTRRPCVAMATSSSDSHLSQSQQRRLPVLLFDVMDTIVRDPFYHHIPAFFQFVSLFNLVYSLSIGNLNLHWSFYLNKIRQQQQNIELSDFVFLYTVWQNVHEGTARNQTSNCMGWIWGRTYRWGIKIEIVFILACCQFWLVDTSRPEQLPELFCKNFN